MDTDTLPGYYYHPHLTREWYATRDELANRLLKDARWRGTPYQDADVLALFDEQGIHSESERQQGWADQINAQIQWRYELTKGPFAYCDHLAETSRVIPSATVMVALRAFDFDRWRRSLYEVFEVQWRLDVAELKAAGAAVLASEALRTDQKISARHPPTRRFFATPDAYKEYAERYTRFVLEGGVPSTIPFLDTAPTREPEDALHQGSPQNRPRKKVKKYSNRAYFVKELGEVIHALRLSKPSRDPTLEEIAHASDKITGVSLWTEGMSRSTLKARLSKEEHNINLDTVLAELPSPCRRLT